MSASRYFETCERVLDRIQETQTEAIQESALRLTEAIVGGHKLFSSGSSHSFMLTEEVVYRTGGLMLINPIVPHGTLVTVFPIPMTSQVERVEGLGRVYIENSGAGEGDVLILASVSGRNPVPVDMALAAGERGVTVIAITSVDYTNSVTSRHSSGKKLADCADIVIDNCVPAGDAGVELPDFPQKVGPLSSLAGIAIVNALVCQTVANLLERGVTPPVYISANLPGGDEHNRRLLAENEGRITYL